jgi:hypothetical protein
MRGQQTGAQVGYVWVEYGGDGTLTGYLGSDALYRNRQDSQDEKTELDQIAAKAGRGEHYQLAAVTTLTGIPPGAGSYTAAAVSAVTTAVGKEHDFAGWLGAVLCAAAARLGSSDALIAGRPGSWEAGLVRHLVCGTAGWDDEHLAGYASFGQPEEGDDR